MSGITAQIEIICVGKLKNTSAFYAGIQDYTKRLSSLKFKIIEITGHDQKDELSKIQSKLDKDAALICLDELGQTMKSTHFTQEISTLNTQYNKVQFVIGGADGLNDELRKQSNMLISFGKQTWPHMMVRLMLVEQIYRAQQILVNHPYHRE